MIGYLRKGKEGIQGERGLAYDYILAQNGLFLEAQNPLIKARICVGEALVRGLEPLTERVELAHGLVPNYFLALALRAMRKDPQREVYLAVTWHDGPDQYQIHQPTQEQSAARVSYRPLPNTVLDFHSHGKMPASFSHTDDQDDQGFRISIVIGKLDQREAEYAMRLGVYGYHARVSVPEVFSGDMPRDLALAQNKK
jgi:PRTRC genetic system protein A